MQLIIISIIIGLVAGFLTVHVLKGQLKSVQSQSDAQNYLSAGSLQLHLSTDRFLYENTTRTPRPKSNNK